MNNNVIGSPNHETKMVTATKVYWSHVSVATLNLSASDSPQKFVSSRTFPHPCLSNK